MKERKSVSERFWASVDKSGECWTWSKYRNAQGYGSFWANGKLMKAHRASYELSVGPIGDMIVCHRCDNPPCVRPDHLFLGTRLDNARDSHSKGRYHTRNNRGESNHESRYTLDEVRKIRELRAAGVSLADLAAMFGGARSTICSIAMGHRWVEPDALAGMVER